jgi:hypothetical protein
MAENVKDKLESYQTGTLPQSEQPEVPKINGEGEPVKAPSLYRQLMQTPIRSGSTNIVTDEALAAGFGTSRYDREYIPGMNVEDARAQAQSNAWKIGNGALKGGVTAATTAVNTVAGTVVGLGSALFELGSEVLDPAKKVNLGEIVDAGVNNFLSEQLMKLQKLSEDWFPNYRTEEEQSARYQREWWKHMGTANFIGDSFLKNFGFTVGAMAGGAVASRALGKILATGLANDLMKGVAVAAEGDAAATEALQSALSSIKAGTAMTVDAKKVLSNIKQAAKAINRYDAQMQLFGATVGAMGEGTMEGIMAKNEFLEDYNKRLNQNFKQEYDSLYQNMLDEGNPNFVKNRFEMHDNQIITIPSLTKAGEAELSRRQKELSDRYNHLQEYASDEADRLASTTFLLNLPVLTASNTIQFGRMFSGGWKTSRNAAKTAGGISITKEGIKGAFEGIDNRAMRAVYNAAKVMGSESSEEMIQGTISSGAKRVAENRLAEYNNEGYDPETVGKFADWFKGMVQGGSEYLTDAQNWQEGAMGALTGLFGIPGRFWKGEWNGGVVEAIKSANQEVKASHEAADKLNSLVNSEEFQTRWRNYVRHEKADDEMAQALAEDNQYAWRTASDKQLIGDIMTFADAGKLNDLEEIVNHFGSMTLQDAPQLREVLKGQEGQKDWTDNLSDQEVVDTVKKRADEVKTTIREYRDIYDALSARLPAGASPEFLKEVVFTAEQIKKFDTRFMEMFGETMKAIEPKLRALSGIAENDNSEKSLRSIENVRNAYATLFAGEDTIMPKSIPNELSSAVNFQWLKQQVKDDPETLKKVNDMERLRNDRQDFFLKFLKLRDSKDAQKEFDAQAITPQKMEQAAEQEATKEEMKNLSGMNDIRQKYLEKKTYNEQLKFVQSLEGIEKTNTDAKAFLDLYRPYVDVRNYLDKKQSASNAFDVQMMAVNNLLDDLFREANSADEFLKVPDSIVERIRIKQAPTTEIAKIRFDNAVKELREAMKDFRKSENQTANRKDISNVQVTPNPEQEENPTGRDSSQPASAAPLPAVEGSPEEKEQLAQQEKEAKEKKPKEQDVPVAPAPVTESSLMQDATDALGDGSDFVEEQINDAPGSIVYIRTSIPEISTEEAGKARKAIQNHDRKSLADTDLSDFLTYLDHKIAEWNEKYKASRGKEKKEAKYQLDKFTAQRAGFDKAWKRLSALGAFDYVSTKLSVGDEIEFVIDPSDTDLYYQDKPMIMLRSKGQMLTPLLTSEKYLHIKELREAIMDEYFKWKATAEQPVFVFSKKSKVYVKRPGIVQYGVEKSNITGIHGYSSDSPMMFISKTGKPVIVRGNSDALDKLMGDFSPSKNMANNRAGALYYLASDGEDRLVPVRVDADRFTVENMNNPGTIQDKIRQETTAISELISSLGTDNEDVGETSRKILSHISNLRKYLYLGNYDFSAVKDFKNIGPALRIHPNGTSGEDIFITPSNIGTNSEYLLRKIAELGCQFQIGTDNGTDVANIKELVDSGAVVSNATMLRAKGVDFCAYPWNPQTREFNPVTAKQKEVEAEDRQKKGEEPIIPELENPIIPTIGSEVSELPSFFTSGSYVEGMEEPVENYQQEPDVDKSFDEQPEYMRKALNYNGISADEFNNMTREEKERAFHCIG